MRKSKAEKLRASGYRVSDTKDFLELSDAEAALIELKIALSERLRTLRQQKGVSQVELAAKLGSSQSRVAKMEAATSNVSLDLLVRALLMLGDDRRKLGKTIAEAA